MRTTRIFIRVTNGEKQIILARMKELDIDNLSEYARQLLLSGQVIKRDFHALKGLTAQIGKIGSNVNQIAKRANESGSVPPEQVDELKHLLMYIHRVLGKELKGALK